jgi:signal peptidase I
MQPKAVLIILSAFIVGIVSTLAFTYYYPLLPSYSRPTTTTYVTNTPKEEDNSNFITKILSTESEERISPYDWIGEENIKVESSKVCFNVPNAQWSRFTDSNSMDPVIDDGANAIQIVPKDVTEIHIGDIVSYESEYAEGIIIHRVFEIGYDEKGWYALVKGDNNTRIDPGKIRFSQIRRVVVAIIY